MAKFKAFLTVFLLLAFTVKGNADHFNPSNLIDSCKQDTSFDSVCYTYLAAYRDALGGVLFADSDEERMKLFCLLDVPTKDMAEHLKKSEYPYKYQPVPDYLVKRFCD